MQYIIQFHQFYSPSEMTCYIKKRKKGKEGYAAIKLYMNKAYDRVEWNFLRDMMQKLGFDGRSIELVMKCVSSVKYNIRVNGEVIDEFIPECGLRQGDSVSLQEMCHSMAYMAWHQVKMSRSDDL